MTSDAGTGPSVSLGCFSGINFVVVFELIGIITESNVPSFLNIICGSYVIPLRYVFKLIGLSEGQA